MRMYQYSSAFRKDSSFPKPDGRDPAKKKETPWTIELVIKKKEQLIRLTNVV